MRCTQKDIREKLGITRDTLRFYEQKGIIEPEIDPTNGYRYYDDWQVNLLWDCKHYQAMGFSLAEVLEILKTDSAGQLRERIEGGRALETWVDAGERWNMGLRLFEPLLAEASSRGLSPRGELCADLIARAHNAGGSYHRYLHAYLPLAG